MVDQRNSCLLLKLMKKIKIFEAFSGVGSQRMALRNLGIEHEVVAIAEIDKYAIRSYEAIHGKTLNLGDISQINTESIPDHDLFTYSFPCQDISVAGHQEGLDEGSGTRSGLLWECQKVISVKKPKYLLLENVKNLVGKRHKGNFNKWLDWLELQGYSNYWQVLNAKDYGIPQNRERVFVVSILGEHESFKFPKKQELKLRLRDLLEKQVDEKFYMNNDKIKQFLNQLDYQPTEIIKLNQIGNFEKLANPNKKFNDPQVGRVLDPEGISQALDTMQGGNRQPKIIEIGNVNPSGRGMNGDVVSTEGISKTLTTNKGEGPKVLTGYGEVSGYRIRKLIPLECWRLMGFKDKDFYKAEVTNSNSQLYKQSGNSIVVPVLEAIFRNLLNV